MPDVGRSDSQRSDSSQRPRVSFNRDVHVKRIGPAGGGGGSPRLVGALAGDGAGHLVPLAVRRERPGKLSRRQLAAEARRVLQQADRIACSSTADLAAGDAPRDRHRNFATLPPLRLGRGSQGGKGARRSLSFREPKKDKSKAPAGASDAVDAGDAAAPAAPKRAGSFKRSRVTLTRSASDAGKRDAHGGKGAPRNDAVVFASLQRPKKHRNHHSDHSDRSPSPTAKPRRHILKKSYSDSETAPVSEAPSERRKKKQLSPIIEVSPREDYFGQQQRGEEAEAMLRAERAAAPAAPGRAGRSAVETMVKRLSADAARVPRRPPRGVSPSALVTPGDERRHNNNLPFSYTEPPQPGAGSPTRGGSPTGFAPPPPPQQVIYAEVVVSGGGHGQLPSKQTVHTAVPLHSDEDEGLGLSMDGFHRRADYRKEFAAEYEGVGGAEPLLDRGRADGMDARRKDPLSEESTRYDSFYRSGRDGYDNAYKTTDEYSSYKMEYRNADSGVGLLRSREGSPVRNHTRVLDSGDLSSRRDRLESRIESQRKDRFVTSRFADSTYKNDATENSRIGSDIAYNNRRDFLNSQLDYERDIRHENARNIRHYNDVDPKKDLFADSGIEVDYRKEGSYKRYDDSSNVKTEGMTAKIVIGSPPRGGSGGGGGENGSARVTRVELNGRRAALPPEDETDGPSSGSFVYRASSSASAHHSGGANSFSSTRLVQEQRRTTDVLPASSVLIRHYAPKRGGSPSASERLLHSERAATAADRGPASEDEYETRAPRREAPDADDPRRASPEPARKADDKAKKGKDPKKKNVSAMDRVKQLFSRGGGSNSGDSKTLKKNKKKEGKTKSKEPVEPEEDPVRARYTEYKGSTVLESDQETLTPTYREHESPPPSPRRQPSPTRVVDAEALRRRERTPSPYGRNPREHSPVRGPPSPRRGPSPAPDPHLLQVPGAHHPSRPRAPLNGPAGAKKAARKEDSEIEFNYSRQRLATPDLTPTPSPAPVRAAQSSTTLTRINNHKNKEQHGGSWFKSLDRLTKRNKNRTKEEEKENSSYRDKSNGSSKTLRYFGDTDQEDKDSVASIPPPMPLQNHHRYKSSNHLGQSNSSTINRLHVSSSSSRNTANRSHRPHHRSAGDVATSSAESTTEGDSSQQSQRSVVYLHAATVGDIPTPKRNVTRRAQSREELSSLTSSHLQPHKRTISRSISVLAPWRPRHYREGQEVHYDQEDNNKNYIKNGKPPKIPVSQQSSLNSATMNRINRKKNLENKANASHKQHVSKATSIESLSQHSTRQNGESRGTLKKQSLVHQAASVESLSHRSNHSISRTQNRNKSNDKKNSMMNASTSELTATYKQNNQKKNSTDTGKKGAAKISRSASMPKDTRVKAGWFKLRNKKQGT